MQVTFKSATKGALHLSTGHLVGHSEVTSDEQDPLWATADCLSANLVTHVLSTCVQAAVPCTAKA